MFRSQRAGVVPSSCPLSCRIATAFPEGPDGGVKIKVISGKSHGVQSPVRPLGGCWYFHVIFDKQGKAIFQDIRK